jgi:hypothetical protein
MNTYKYFNGVFYPYFEKKIYVQAGSWPATGVDVDDVTREQFFVYPSGKMPGTDENGNPVWVDVPPPTHDEQVRQAEEKKQQLIGEANDYMNSKQWSGKAAMNRLSDVEKAQYNAWLDYLDELEAGDTSSAPDIDWPEKPA